MTATAEPRTAAEGRYMQRGDRLLWFEARRRYRESGARWYRLYVRAGEVVPVEVDAPPEAEYTQLALFEGEG